MCFRRVGMMNSSLTVGTVTPMDERVPRHKKGSHGPHSEARVHPTA
jgi:hypothetical protein